MKKIEIRNNFSMLFLPIIQFLILVLLMLMVKGLYIRIFIYFCAYCFLIYLLFKKRKFDLLSVPTLFTIYHILYIGMCPVFLVIQYLMNPSSELISSIIFKDEFINQQCLWILLTFCVFVITTIIVDSKKSYETGTVNIKDKSLIQYSNLIGEVMIVISFAFEIIYLRKNIEILFSGNLESGRIDAMAGNGILLYGIWLGTFGTVIMYEQVLRGKFSKKLFWLICFLHGTSILLIGFRSRLITLLILMILVRNRYKKIPNKMVIKIGIFMLILVIALGLLRNIMSGNQENNFAYTTVASLANRKCKHKLYI